jgi:hypothetical protein
MHVIETFGLLFGEGNLFDGNDLKAGLVNFGEDGCGVAIFDRVRLDDAEGALGHLNLLIWTALQV